MTFCQYFLFKKGKNRTKWQIFRFGKRIEKWVFKILKNKKK